MPIRTARATTSRRTRSHRQVGEAITQQPGAGDLPRANNGNAIQDDPPIDLGCGRTTDNPNPSGSPYGSYGAVGADNSGLIALGGGHFFDPSTGNVHYAGSQGWW